MPDRGEDIPFELLRGEVIELIGPCRLHLTTSPDTGEINHGWLEVEGYVE